MSVCVCVYLLCWWSESCCRLFKLICVNRDSEMEGREQSVICLSASASPLIWVFWTCPFSLRPAPDPDRPAFIRILRKISPSVHSFTPSAHLCAEYLLVRLSILLFFTSEWQVWPPSVHHSTHRFFFLIFWPIHPFSPGMNTTNPSLPSWCNVFFWNLLRKNLKWVSISFCAGPWELWFPKCSSE